MSQQEMDALKYELQELKDEIKNDVKNDLGAGYYKMSQTKLVSLIGCTISVCLCVFGAAIYIDRSLHENKAAIESCQKDVAKGNNQIDRLWSECASLQIQINNNKK